MRNNKPFSDYDGGIETISIMKRKILVIRLGSDMNDGYYKETIDPQDELNYQTSDIDHPKQDQHDQKKTAVARRVHT